MAELLISEVLQKVSNAKTKAQKIKLLRDNNSDALRKILIVNFDPSIESALPDGDVPYKPNEAPPGTEHSRLSTEHRILYYFVKGGADDLSSLKRETMFVGLLEGLHESEAEVVCLAKDKNLKKKYRITENVVKEAFPQIQWGNRTAPPKPQGKQWSSKGDRMIQGVPLPSMAVNPAETRQGM